MLKAKNLSFVAFLAITLVFASTGYVLANPVSDTFYDTSGQTYTDLDCTILNVNPGDKDVVDEHGGYNGADFPLWWEERSEDVGLTFAYGDCSGTALRITIWNTTHTSPVPHTMWDTMLAFEQNAYDWKGTVLAANSWDGVDNTNDAAIYFGDIRPNESVTRYISLMDGYSSPDLLYDSAALDSDLSIPEIPNSSNVSITHAPEPISSILFVTGGTMLGLRRFRKRKMG